MKRKLSFTEPIINRGEKVEFCRNCGEYLDNRWGNYARRERDHYCSIECWHKDHPIKYVTRTCHICKEEFQVKASALDHRPAKYCSRKCYRADRIPQIVLTCDQCGEPFEMYYSELKARKGRFCNRACYRDSLQSS